MTSDEAVRNRMLTRTLLILFCMGETSGQLLQQDFLWEVCSEYFRSSFVILTTLNNIPSEISTIITRGLQDRLAVSVINLHIQQHQPNGEKTFRKYRRSDLGHALRTGSNKSARQSSGVPLLSCSFTSIYLGLGSIDNIQFNNSHFRDTESRIDLHKDSEETMKQEAPNEYILINSKEHLFVMPYTSELVKISRNLPGNFIILCNKDSDIIDYFSMLHKSNEFWSPRDNILIILLIKHKLATTNLRKKREHLLQHLWREFQIMTAIMMFIEVEDGHCRLEIEKQIIAFNPFQKSSAPFGEIQVINEINAYTLSQFSTNAERSYNGYPLRVTMFPRMPTAIKRTDDVIHGLSNYSESYIGVDGIILNVLSEHLNFISKIQMPTDGKEYGYYLPNGSFVGTLGDILYGRTDISLNGVFIKSYRTNLIEFSHYAYHDSVCIIVPKAAQVPKWIIFGGVDLKLKLGILIVYIASSCIYYLQEQCHRYWHKNQRILDTTEIFLDMIHPFLQTPFAQLSSVSSQRVIACSTLIFGFFIGSILQGIMVTGMTKPFYYSEIDTLEQLDNSGLPIYTGSPNLADTFGIVHKRQQCVSIMSCLSWKLHIVSDSNEDKWDVIARKRNQAIIIRRSDYLDISEAGNNQLHVMQECPRHYLIAYLLPKGSPFLPMIDRTLARLLAAGLPRKWSMDTLFGILIKKRGSINTGQEVFSSFSVEDMLTAFLVLLGGWSLSLIVFIAEMILPESKRDLASGFKKKLRCQ